MGRQRKENLSRIYKKMPGCQHLLSAQVLNVIQTKMIPISLVDSKKVRFVHTGVEGVRLEPISSLTINRHSLPTAVPVDIRSGFVAEQIDAFKVGASVIPLTDAKDVHNFGILSIREV